MTSFFDKLSLRLNGGKQKAPPRSFDRVAQFSPKKDQPNAPAAQNEEELLQSQRLDVDVFQDPARVIVYALAPGVDPNAFEVILDEENDVLSIRGVRKRPDVPPPPEGVKPEDGKFIEQECAWEPFFRKVVLPAEVDPVKAEAVFTKGVLIVTLPILRVAEGRKLVVSEVLSQK